ncbi:MAG: VWA domain-containing protein [Clostridia bacterium]|nr:VWA domain-containing protein [Clostridia bacterium]MBR6619730.1 VWA domain-containing protein [Clostridia bacterium]
MNKITKIFSVVLSLIMVSSMLVIGVSAASLRKLDLAFVVDTTGSMGSDIYQVKTDIQAYLDDLDASGMDYRIAIVEYRDFPERTDDYADFAYRVSLDFSDNYDNISSSIKAIDLGDGGDWEETVLSALIDGLDSLSWRSEAGKAAILMGDAPALDPEPITGYTTEMAINKLVYDDVAYEDSRDYSLMSITSNFASQATARSKVTLFTIATSGNSETIACFDELASGTGGRSFTAGSSEDITGIITEIIDEIPEVVEDAETFWDKVLNFLMKIFYFITFQWDKL